MLENMRYAHYWQIWFGVIHGHWKWHPSIDDIQLPTSLPLSLLFCCIIFKLFYGQTGFNQISVWKIPPTSWKCHPGELLANQMQYKIPVNKHYSLLTGLLKSANHEQSCQQVWEHNQSASVYIHHRLCSLCIEDIKGFIASVVVSVQHLFKLCIQLYIHTDNVQDNSTSPSSRHEMKDR